jgi:hypothetical protein
MLPKTQYLREHIYQVLFSMLVHHYYKVALLSVVTLLVPQHYQVGVGIDLPDLPWISLVAV